MAQWLALTTYGADQTVQVNLDQVAFMQDLVDRTVLHFATSQGDGHLVWTVSETVGRINILKSVGS